MTHSHADHPEGRTPSELRAIERGLDEIGSQVRGSPDSGFENRLASAATRALAGQDPLRIVHPKHERGSRHVSVVRWGLASAAVLAIASAVVAIRHPGSGSPVDPNPTQYTNAAATELDEIAAVWELLDDASIDSRVSSLHGQASTLSESILGDWVPTSMTEDSM